MLWEVINLDSLSICWSLDGLELKLKSLSHSPHKYLLSILGPVQAVRGSLSNQRFSARRNTQENWEKERKAIWSRPQRIHSSLPLWLLLFLRLWSTRAPTFLAWIWDWLFWVWYNIYVYMFLLIYLSFVHFFHLFKKPTLIFGVFCLLFFLFSISLISPLTLFTSFC